MKKRGALSIEQLIGLILLLAFLVIASGIIFLTYEEFDSSKMSQFSCWMTNGLKSSNSFFKKVMPTTCSLEILEESQSKEEVANLLVDTWWMYHQGEIDVDWSASLTSVYSFKLKEEFTYDELLQHLIEHKGTSKVKKLEDSDFNYLQQGSEGPTLCIEASIFEGGMKLNKDQAYYILFFDSNRLIQSPLGEGIIDLGDKLIITPFLTLEEGGNYYCPSYGDLYKGIEIYDAPGSIIGVKEI